MNDPAPTHSTTNAGAACWTCDPGWVDCGAGACSSDVTSDPYNCGGCGFVCPNGTCATGSCQHVDTLAQNLVSPTQVVVDSEFAYFVDDVSGNGSGGWVLDRTPLGGGDVQPLVTLAGPVGSLSVDQTGLYFFTETTVSSGESALLRLPTTGPRSTPITVARDTGLLGWRSLALGSNSVWWLGPHLVPSAGSATDPAAPAKRWQTDLVLAAESGFAQQVVGTASDLAVNILGDGPQLALAGGDAFFGDGADVVVVRANASTVEALAIDSQPVTEVAVDDTYVYWTTATIGGAANSPTPALRRVPRVGGAEETIALAGLRSLVADQGLVWGAQSGQGGDLLVRFDGSGMRTVLAGGIGSIGGLAIDATSVHWTVQDPAGNGRLLRTNR